jgi:hypothetical protein
MIPDSVPVPSAGYPEPSSNIIIPSALPSEFTSEYSCSMALTTITTTRTVSVVTQIPSSLLIVTGIVELSSFMPSQPASSAVTVIVPGSSAADEESSVVPPQVPYPTASSKPVSTTTVASTSSTSTPGLPEFTDAAEAMKVPVVVAGLLGWAALVL